MAMTTRNAAADDGAYMACKGFVDAKIHLKALLADADADADPEAVGLAKAAYLLAAFSVVSLLRGRRSRRHTIPGWRVSLDRVGVLHACAVVPRARRTPPALLHGFTRMFAA